jgi:integrase
VKAKRLEQRLGLTLRFEAFAEEYLAYYRTDARPRSVERHESAYRALKPTFGSLRLADITPYLVEQYKQQRRAISRAAATINRELTFLNHLVTMAITWGKVAENPVKRVKRFHEPHGHTRCLTPAEEDRLLDASNPPLKPVVGELLSLRWADVNIPRRLVTVQAAYAKDRQPRSIPIDTILLQALEALPRLDDPQALVFGYHDIKHTFR